MFTHLTQESPNRRVAHRPAVIQPHRCVGLRAPCQVPKNKASTTPPGTRPTGPHTPFFGGKESVGGGIRRVGWAGGRVRSKGGGGGVGGGRLVQGKPTL